jgi:hypothetical protein
MVTVQVLCAGYIDIDSITHECGKLLRAFESETPMVSHGLCGECYTNTLATFAEETRRTQKRHDADKLAELIHDPLFIALHLTTSGFYQAEFGASYGTGYTALLALENAILKEVH